ncbi:hypothetical protein RB195_000729 [Necator americanus]|uniref:Uncharacterized protein n=1 Tax=Necator americanus TaxID=51031 RepID=A0ABR1DBZ1_NECAM
MENLAGTWTLSNHRSIVQPPPDFLPTALHSSLTNHILSNNETRNWHWVRKELIAVSSTPTTSLICCRRKFFLIFARNHQS